MLASVRSAVLVGVDAHPVSVEVHVSSGGLPAYNLVGLPDAAVRESRERIRAAILSSGLEWPSRRITVNLAPSGLRKSGPGLDLPAALGVLIAHDLLPESVLEGIGVIGELGFVYTATGYDRHRAHVCLHCLSKVAVHPLGEIHGRDDALE